MWMCALMVGKCPLTGRILTTMVLVDPIVGSPIDYRDKKISKIDDKCFLIVERARKRKRKRKKITLDFMGRIT